MPSSPKQLLSGLVAGGMFLYGLYWVSLVFHPFFETDAERMITGSILVVRGFDAHLPYRFDNQPLYYQILYVFMHLLDPARPAWIAVGSVVCLLLFLGFVLAAAWRVRGARYALLLAAALLLCHDLLIAGAYPNASIAALAALGVATGTLFLWNFSWGAIVAAGILCGLSPHLRNDAAFVAPALVVLVALRGEWAKAGALAGIAAVTGLLFIPITGFDATRAMRSAEAHSGEGAASDNPFWHLLLAAPVAWWLLGLGGVVALGIRRAWKPIVVVAVAVVPLSIFFFPAMTTPKYMLYAFPVVAWLAGEAWLALEALPEKASWVARGVAGAAVVAQLVFPSRTLHPTADGPRPFLGTVLYPVLVQERQHELDTALQKRLAKLDIPDEYGKVGCWFKVHMALAWENRVALQATGTSTFGTLNVMEQEDGRKVIVQVMKTDVGVVAVETWLSMRADGWAVVLEGASDEQLAGLKAAVPAEELKEENGYVYLAPTEGADAPVARPIAWKKEPVDAPAEVLRQEADTWIIGAARDPVRVCEATAWKPSGPVTVTGEWMLEGLQVEQEKPNHGALVLLAGKYKDGEKYREVLVEARGDRDWSPVNQVVEVGEDVKEAKLCLSVRGTAGSARFKGFQITR